MKIFICAAMVILTMTPITSAGDFKVPKDWQLSATSGTLGHGIEADWRFSPDWGLRAGLNTGTWSYLHRAKKADFRSDILMLNGGLTADYYPGGGNFRLSAGARLSANEITGRVENVTRAVKIFGMNGTAIIKDPLTRYSLTQNPVQPYIGGGYSYRYSDRLTFNFDVGGLYTGAPDIAVMSHANRLGITDKQISSQIDRARSRAAIYQYYPVVQLGFKFRF